ncbi:aspartic proteinase nepenthesin-2-like [Rhodamnia argentea]|uniref:Aspartic proteinase nepenthesin-2-like n=1 Tax=Rhodamnia argentea TaxID=178133 RepID=A0A8B8MNB4_9MYRT|nr:aspartic proteinase nepenthesin-2-like [Rhodamnia argentea]
MASSSSVEWKKSTGHGPNAPKPKVTKHPILGYYITSLMVGKPSYSTDLIVSTGSYDTWMQREGCTTSFPLRQGNFDRKKSRAYRPLPCEHPLCDPHICINGSCASEVSYTGTVSITPYNKGQVGLETFIFQDGYRSIKGFPKIVFSCGLDNHNMQWVVLGENSTVSGALGLAWGKRSILTQYANETKGCISYCLPSWYAGGGTYTSLNFGDNVRIGGHPRSIVQTTALISNVMGYIVNVMGISINGKRLNINPEAFRRRPDHTGGFVLDSGTSHTGLVQIA